MAVVKVKYDGSNSINNTSRSRLLLLEDPNPTYNRLFIDHQAFDMATLTPQWNKQFMYASTNSSAVGWHDKYSNFNNWQQFTPSQTYFNGFAARNASISSYTNVYGPTTIMLSSDIYPLDDYEYHRFGEIITQKGTISTYAQNDSITVFGTTNSWDTRVPNTIRDILGTYWHSLDFNNYPISKNWKSAVTGNIYMCKWYDGSLFSGGINTTGTTQAVNMRPQYEPFLGWYFMVYMPDITQQLIPSATRFTSGAQIVNNTGSYSSASPNMTHIFYEDVLTGNLFGFHITPITTYFMKMSINNIGSIGFSSPYSAGNQDAGYGHLYYMGLDTTNRIYCLQHQIQNAGEPYSVVRYDPRQSVTTTVVGTTTVNSTLRGRRLEPSNIRRDANNRYVFYSSHINLTGNAWQPVRFVWDPTSNSDSATNGFQVNQCNVSYPGANTFASYSTLMSLAYEGGGQGSANTYNYPWRTKPWQFVSNGNVYITFWMVDQFASWLGTAVNAATTSRWATTQQRTMMTYQIGSNTPGSTPTGNSDLNLSFHSGYTFQNVIDIPKNFMPLNANGTLMAVVSGSKTNFFVWNNTTGWNAGGVYNTEFRMLGLDSTGRLWGSACDQNNGTLHIVTPSLSMNVTLSLATTNYTYTGTPISTSATVNVYDSYSNRVQTTVTLTMDGTSSVFTNNGLRTITVTTNPSGDTVVPITINSAGVNNIYVAINNA